ncbi:hypothetical protein [Aliivibrio sifiae]|uniref:Uncharacterized protein n=1 Tax=Aliivibrio sifiae TaxID=566293 RepID=A0A2S7X3K7_9GAMM|nr:hypothetical protein [Aliivibrio sifiae]PQJ84619.1 hypothetical protein BTO22_13980 [Aliivibrio sifiae]
MTTITVRKLVETTEEHPSVRKFVYSSKVIMVNTSRGLRFFSGFGKKNRVLTAWCLSGAKLFLLEDARSCFDKLQSLNKEVFVHTVECSPVSIASSLDL